MGIGCNRISQQNATTHEQHVTVRILGDASCSKTIPKQGSQSSRSRPAVTHTWRYLPFKLMVETLTFYPELKLGAGFYEPSCVTLHTRRVRVAPGGSPSEKGEVLLRGVGTPRYVFPPDASVQWQPTGLTIHTQKGFPGAGFLGAPPFFLTSRSFRPTCSYYHYYY